MHRFYSQWSWFDVLKGFKRVSKSSRRRGTGSLSMYWILLRKRMDVSLSAMKKGMWWRICTASFIQELVATHGGTMCNSSRKLTKWSQFSRRHILIASHSLCLISRPHMPRLGLMHFVPLIWTDQTGANRENKRILWFCWIIRAPSSVARHKAWPLRLARQKASDRCSRNAASTCKACVQNALPFALLRILAVSWHYFWASKMTSGCKNPSSSRKSKGGGISACSSLSFIASSIQSRWFFISLFFW